MSGSTKTETVNGGYSGSGSSLGQAQAGGTGGGGVSYVSPQLSLDNIVSAAASAGYDGDLRPYYAYE